MTDPIKQLEALVAQATEAPLKPNAQTIEATLLVAAFATPELAALVLGDTRPGDYYFDEHRRIAAVVYPPLLAGNHVDLVTIEASLPDPGDDQKKVDQNRRLLDVANQLLNQSRTAPPSKGQVEAYLGIFLDDAKRRQATALLNTLSKTLEDGDVAPVDAAAKAFDIVADLEASRRLIGTFKSEADDWATYFAALKASQDPKNDFIGLNTGFQHLNRVINGLTPGLFILGAMPSVGKTTFAKQLGDQVVEGNAKAAVVFFSFEQSREELRVKTLSRLSGIENRDILRGRLDVATPGWERVQNAAATFAGNGADRFFVIEADKTMTPERIRLAVHQVRRATQVDHVLVIVDYLQIIPTAEQHRDPRSRIDAVVSDLRRVARDLDASVFALSAVGRASYTSGGKVDIGMEAFKESGGIEYGADIGGLLLPVKDDPSSPSQGKENVSGTSRTYQRVNLEVVKNRNGETATVGMKFFKAISRFIETQS